MIRHFLIFAALETSPLALLSFSGHHQSVSVSGRLVCNGKPASGVKVRLYDDGIVYDSKLDEGITNINGEFKLSGKKREVTRIDPKVNIYHRCNFMMYCYKKLSISVPKDYITKGEVPQRTYDIGSINLVNDIKGESMDCIN